MCISWCANQMSLRNARSNDKDGHPLSVCQADVCFTECTQQCSVTQLGYWFRVSVSHRQSSSILSTILFKTLTAFRSEISSC